VGAGGYPIAEILSALAQYVKRHSDIPAPADIVNIIDPPKAEWKPDWPAYIALKKRVQRDGYYPYGTEKRFLQMCDEYAIKRTMESAEPVNEDERTARGIATGEKVFALEGQKHDLAHHSSLGVRMAREYGLHRSVGARLTIRELIECGAYAPMFPSNCGSSCQLEAPLSDKLYREFITPAQLHHG